MKGEIIYQARRLDSHPALAIWGGGNEVEASFRWFPDSRDNPQFYTPDYIQVSRYACPLIFLAPPYSHIHSVAVAFRFLSNYEGDEAGAVWCSEVIGVTSISPGCMHLKTREQGVIVSRETLISCEQIHAPLCAP